MGVTFLAATFLLVVFLATAFLATTFLLVVFLATAFLATTFLLVVFLATAFSCSLFSYSFLSYFSLVFCGFFLQASAINNFLGWRKYQILTIFASFFQFI